MQTVANTVGIDSLQKEINAENVVELRRMLIILLIGFLRNSSAIKHQLPIYGINELDRIQTSLTALKSNIQLSGRSKRMAFWVCRHPLLVP